MDTNSEKKSDVAKFIVPILRQGGIGVFPTDTLYGLVGSALKKETVEKIYKFRKRDLKKPMIILISSFDDLKIFEIDLNKKHKEILHKMWPGKVSIVLDCPERKFKYLHRGNKTLAFRFPKDKNLIKVLKKTGPLVAPSANVAGEKPSETTNEAKKYFGNEVDFYVDFGKLKSKPSTLVKIDTRGNLEILRQGAAKI